ncbi:flagellar basal body protein [Mongoliimonas terrestris]|uniref:flagellar basal body protein n=1 Tax=Mongoliimonas terrestris TaxID=1709001 RepID=UPI00094979DB|nr:flagellar basal body protein [Mongoliimonas terrestris]
MEPIFLFKLGFEKLSWLSTRQAAVAENVANANTPGFRALEIEPFSEELRRYRLKMAVTRPLHMTGGRSGVEEDVSADTSAWAVSASGNSVSLEQEMIKQARVAEEQNLATASMRTFHRMLLMTTRG